MKLELKLFEVETLIFVLAEKIHYRERNNLSLGDLAHIKKMMEVQLESYKEKLIDELKKQYGAGESLSVVSLQRQESIGYGKAAKLIEQAKAEVEYERRIAEYRKEQEQ